LSRIALPPAEVAEPHDHVPAVVTNDPAGAAIVVPSGDRPGVPVTVTVVEALAVPVVPVQARLNARVLVSPPVEALPETALAPPRRPASRLMPDFRAVNRSGGPGLPRPVETS